MLITGSGITRPVNKLLRPQQKPRQVGGVFILRVISSESWLFNNSLLKHVDNCSNSIDIESEVHQAETLSRTAICGYVICTA
jgi:hypothetical protein